MDALTIENASLGGLFVFAAVHYAIQWWFSRDERVLLAFSIQCFAYTAFCVGIAAYFRAKTIPEAQAALVRFVTVGVIIHALTLNFYSKLGRRRDRAFQAVVTGLLLFLAILNQWVPLRGTVIELKTVPLPGGASSLLAIRTPPGASLALLYLAVLAVQSYGFVVARDIWTRDRAGAFWIALGATAVLAGAALGFLVDFMKVRAPYAGALPHAVFVICMALYLAREYAARGARLASEQRRREEAEIDRRRAVEAVVEAQRRDIAGQVAAAERLEELVAGRTRELREAKDEAERANQAKSRFLAHISHEIRSPLHVMLLNAGILEGDPSLAPEPLKGIKTIQNSGKHLAAIINNVLDMSKIEAGRVTLVEAPFDVGAMLDEVAQMFSADVASRGIELTIERPSEPPPSLVGDGDKVKSILINLVSNAAKFTRGGSIRVTSTWSAVDEVAVLVEIVVADSGIGISEREREKIFQPFVQLDGGAHAGGTGLGLAISLAYARLMGGDLSLESAPGAGSRFKVTFVAQRRAVEQMRASEATTPAAATAPVQSKVLIVDDIDVIRDGAAVVLAKHGFDTRTAADGATGLSVHDEWIPDVVLMDMRMPGMNGVEAIRQLRAGGSRAVIGAVTAGAYADDEREALRAGADFFVRKPFDEQELLDGLGRVLAARRVARQDLADVSEAPTASNRNDVLRP